MVSQTQQKSTYVAQKTFQQLEYWQKGQEPEVRGSAREAQWNLGCSVTDSRGKKYQWAAVFNCDITTYFLALQCHIFKGTDNPSTLGSERYGSYASEVVQFGSWL
jgi:hypothetical protein